VNRSSWSLKFEDTAQEQKFLAERAVLAKDFLSFVWLPAIVILSLLLFRDLFLGSNSRQEIFASVLRAILLGLTVALYFFGRLTKSKSLVSFHRLTSLWVITATGVLVAIATSQSLLSEARYYRALLGFLLVLGLFGSYFRESVARLYAILVFGWLVISYAFKGIATNNLEGFVSGQVTFIGMMIVVLTLNRAIEKADRRAFQANYQLTFALEEVKKASAEKSTFLMSLSHDLRQPLTGLTGFLDLTKRHTEKFQDPILNSCLDGAIRGSDLINLNLTKILELGRIQDERFEPHIEAIRINDLLQEVCSLLETRAAIARIQLKLILAADEDQWVETDPVLLGQVFQNLVSNAIQYRKPGPNQSWVLVSCIRLGLDVLRITVTDNGIGIPKEFQAKIFDPHFQLGNPRRSSNKGLGLGLAFVAHTITRLDRHKLTVSSNGRSGTKFSVYVPVPLKPAVT
jgi:signal transduction histidine kinase